MPLNNNVRTVSQRCGTTDIPLCVVWRKPLSPTSLIQVSYSEPIHTAASAGKWGSGSGGIGNDAIICLGILQPHPWVRSVVSCQEHAKRTDQFAFLSPNTPRPTSSLSFSQPMVVPHKFHQMHVYRDHVGYLQPNHPTAPDAV